jgi:hypothetical protein
MATQTTKKVFDSETQERLMNQINANAHRSQAITPRVVELSAPASVSVPVPTPVPTPPVADSGNSSVVPEQDVVAQTAKESVQDIVMQTEEHPAPIIQSALPAPILSVASTAPTTINPKQERKLEKYADVFLSKGRQSTNCMNDDRGSFSSVGISTKLYDKVGNIINLAFGGRISIGWFISNVLYNHIDEYRDEILQLFENNKNKGLEL